MPVVVGSSQTYQFAGHYNPNVPVFPGEGLELFIGSEVAIRKASDGTLAVVYTDRTKTETTTNPVVIDTNGNLAFFTDPGAYTAHLVLAGGSESAALALTIPVDPEDAATDADFEALKLGINTEVTDRQEAVATVTATASTASTTATAAQTAITNHIADETAAHVAGAVSYIPSGASTALNVQDGLDQLETNKATTGSVSTVSTGLSDHIGDASDAHDASAVSYVNTTSGLTATTAQAAIDELAAMIAAHLADTTDAHDASAISFTPTGTIAADDVQEAIAEVASEAGSGGGGGTATFDSAAASGTAADTTSTTHAIVLPSTGVNTGDLLVAIFSMTGTTTPFTGAYGMDNGWTEFPSGEVRIDNSANGHSMTAWYKVAAADNSGTLTVNTARSIECAVVCISGSNTTGTPRDVIAVSNSVAATSNTYTAPSATPTAAGLAIIAWGARVPAAGGAAHTAVGTPGAGATKRTATPTGAADDSTNRTTTTAANAALVVATLATTSGAAPGATPRGVTWVPDSGAPGIINAAITLLVKNAS